MAFENLRPHEAFILSLIDEGRTLSQVVDALASRHGVRTTPGTISRFASTLKPVRSRPAETVIPPSLFDRPRATAPALASEALSPAQDPGPDIRAMLTEILASIDGAREEGRDVLERVSGKVAGLSGDVAELEKALEPVRRVGGEAEEHAADLARLIASLKAELLEKLDTLAAGQGEIAAQTARKVSPQALAQIWTRAFVVAFIIWGIIIGVLLLAAGILSR